MYADAAGQSITEAQDVAVVAPIIASGARSVRMGMGCPKAKKN